MIKVFEFMIILSLVFKSSALRETFNGIFTINHSEFLCKVIYVHYREYFVKIDKKLFCNYRVKVWHLCIFYCAWSIKVYKWYLYSDHGGNLIQSWHTFYWLDLLYTEVHFIM